MFYYIAIFLTSLFFTVIVYWLLLNVIKLINTTKQKSKKKIIVNLSVHDNNSFDLKYHKKTKSIEVKNTIDESLKNTIIYELSSKSLLRSCFSPIILPENYKKDACSIIAGKEGSTYIYQNGDIHRYNLKERNKYIVPITSHFYSEHVDQYSNLDKGTKGTTNLYIGGLRGANYLAYAENSSLFTALVNGNKTSVYNNIQDSVASYKCFKDFKEKNVNSIIVLLPSDDPYNNLEVMEEIKHNLSYSATISSFKVNKSLFELQSLSAIILEAKPELEIYLMQQGDIEVKVNSYNNIEGSYIELMINYGIVFNNLGEIALCFNNEATRDSILNV
jgi:hypothetical protein